MRVTGTIDAPEIDGAFSLASGSFAIGALPPVHDVALRASYARGLLDLQHMRAQWQGAQIAASGQMPATLLGDRLPEAYRKTLPPLDGRARATARIDSLTQAALAPFVSAETIGEMTGRFDMVATLEAGSLDVEDVTGELVFERAELALARAQLAQVRPTRFRIAGRRAEIVAWNWAGGGNRFDVAGSALLSGDDPQLDVLVTGMLDLRMLGAFSSDVVTAGTATLDVRVTGSPAEPAVAGQISIRDGNIVVRDPRIAVTGLVGTLDIARDQLELRDVTASANGGTLRIAGSIQYPGLALTGGTIAVTGRRLGFDLPEGLRTEVDTDLELALSATGSSLTGSVNVLRGCVPGADQSHRTAVHWCRRSLHRAGGTNRAGLCQPDVARDRREVV